MLTETTPKPFTMFEEDSAPQASQPFLVGAKEAFGLVPNLLRVMSQSPTLLATYMTGWGQFDETSLSPAERQVVYQAANFENDCGYCMAWHTILAEGTGMPQEDVEALRQGSSLSDEKHEALRLFAQAMMRTNGRVEPSALAAFFGVGYSEAQALEVILGLSVKLMSNYANSIAQIPLDDAASEKAWYRPSLDAGSSLSASSIA